MVPANQFNGSTRSAIAAVTNESFVDELQRIPNL